MPVNSTTRIETVVSVVAERSYAFSLQDTLVVLTEIPTGGTVVKLPSNPSGGDAYELADGDGSCSSGSPLTLTVAAGQTIQGGSTLALSSPFAWARATFSEPLHAWVAFAAGASTFGYTPLPYTTIYVDPADETGHASDSSPGTDPSKPIATTTHLNALNFFGRLTANTLIRYLSDDASDTGLNVSTLDLGVFELTIAQTRQVLHIGGALTAGTIAIDPPANQPQVVQTSDLATFAPYLVVQQGGPATYGVRITDTTTGAGAWIMSAATPASPQTTRPVLDGTAGALTIGDPYTLTRGGLLTLASQDAPLGTPGAVLFLDCAFPAASTGFNGAEYTRCSWAGPLQVAASISDCFIQADIIATGTSSGSLAISAGGLITTSGTIWSDSCEMSGDLYVTGDGLGVGGDFFGNLFFFRDTVGAGVQIHDCATTSALAIYEGFSLAIAVSATNPLIWGRGNGQYGLVVNAGQSAAVSSTVPPIVTGTLGDYAFIGANGVGFVMEARAFDETADAYTTLRTTTWANFAASIGSGGFGFQAHSVSSGASLVGV